MVKGKEWLKEEVKSLFDEAYGSGKMEYYESEESIHRINSLVDQLDEPETLNEEWINEHSKAYTMENSVEISDLKNLLVPKQDKPVIPQFVADWIEDYRDHGGLIVDMLDSLTTEIDSVSSVDNEVAQWFRENTEKMLKALTDGYEVEKEKKYTIKLSLPEGVFLRYEGDELFISKRAITTNSNWKYNFTEEEIEAIDKRYWAFAEEAE